MRPMTRFAALCCVLSTTLAAGPAGARGEDEEVGTISQPQTLAPPRPAAGACRQGFVWREARPGDHVCVSPQRRDQVAAQNRSAARLWTKGAYGPHTCVSGYVWREAFEGDTVCVTPEFRESTRRDNEMAARRRAG